MHSASYRRARKILDAHPGSVVAAKACGVIHALLVLALFPWAGLVLSLIFTKGVTTVEDVPSAISGPGTRALPGWIATRLPNNYVPGTRVSDSGLIPIVTRNWHSTNPVHRMAARGLSSLLSRLPALQYNGSALMILLAIGLALTLALSLV